MKPRTVWEERIVVSKGGYELCARVGGWVLTLGFGMRKRDGRAMVGGVSRDRRCDSCTVSNSFQ